MRYMSIREKTISGVFWTFTQQLGTQGINFVVQLFLARILLPEAFGIIAIVQIFTAIGTSLMDGGMTASLIRTENPNQRDYSTIFFINIFSSLVLYFLLYITAPYIADFFRQPMLTPVIRVFTLSFVIQALVGVQTTKLTKEMNFKLQMYMQLPATIVGGIVGLYLATRGAGVWSLVWMHLTTTSLFMLQHWFRTNWRPSWIIDKEKFKLHFNFGYKLTLSSLITNLYAHSYTLIIGRLYSATQLAYYTQANTYRMFPVTHITVALQKVTYPVFSTLQNNNERLKSAFKRITLLVFFIICPIMFSLTLLAEPIFRFVLTEKWLPAVPYFQVLCLSAIVYPHSLYNLNIVLAKGQSGLYFRLEVIKKASAIALFLLIIPFGIWGVIYASALGMLIQAFINALYSGRLINYGLKSQITDVLPIFLIATTAMFLVYLLHISVDKVWVAGDLVNILFGFLFYFLIYFFISYLFKLSSIGEIRNILRQLIKKIKR